MATIYTWPELLASEYRARSAEPGDRLNVYYPVYADSIKAVVNSINIRAILQVISHIYSTPTEVEANGMAWPGPRRVPAGTLVLAAQFEDLDYRSLYLYSAASLGLDGAPGRYVCVHERHANEIRLADLEVSLSRHYQNDMIHFTDTT